MFAAIRKRDESVSGLRSLVNSYHGMS